MRVGKRYFIQTPNLYFPIEPHFVFPFFQFFPFPLRAYLLSKFTLGWMRKAENYEDAMLDVRSIHLLTKKGLSTLFPGAQIYEEIFMGFAKSFTLYRGWDEASLGMDENGI